MAAESDFSSVKSDVWTNANRKVDYGLAGSFGKVNYCQAEVVPGQELRQPRQRASRKHPFRVGIVAAGMPTAVTRMRAQPPSTGNPARRHSGRPSFIRLA